jgi:hypothetical protein
MIKLTNEREIDRASAVHNAQRPRWRRAQGLADSAPRLRVSRFRYGLIIES